MDSNFSFLLVYWPDLAEIGSLAEAYVYSDPNVCIYKLGQLCEGIVNEMLRLENAALPAITSQSAKISYLNDEGYLPKTINDILYVVRIARNDAVHNGAGDEERAKKLLHLTYNLCNWFMQVYGAWDYKEIPYKEPVDRSLEDDYTSKIKEQEQRIIELTEQLEEIRTLTSSVSKDERIKRAEDASENLPELDMNEMPFSKDVRLEIDAIPVMNFALQQNGYSVISSITVKNDSDTPLQDVDIHISANPEFCSTAVKHVDYIPEDNSVRIRNIELQLDGTFFAELTERTTAVLTVSVKKNDVTICEDQAEIEVLVYDEWSGTEIYPELLAAYVLPNHPAVVKICQRVSDYLGKWTGDPSLDAYLSKDPNRVLMQAAAVYASIRELDVVYAVSPASFGKVGQRIRLADQIVEQRMGTCLDLSLLFASVLEALGLNPILILQSGHAFAGVWLEKLTFPEPIQDDVSLMTKRLAEGINELVVFECTDCVKGASVKFDDSRKSAEGRLYSTEAFECLIDIARARLSGIRPMPLRVKTEHGWTIEQPRIRQDELSAQPSFVSGKVEVPERDKNALTRKQIWERRLLDLGLRNTLISMRLSKSVVPVLTRSVYDLADSIEKGESYQILSRPFDFRISGGYQLDTYNINSSQTAVLQSEYENHRLRSVLTIAEFESAVKTLFRNARASIEENGANTLYMVMGLLKWYENSKSTKPRYAPLVLIPVDLVRKSVSQGYSVRIRDEEVQMNITILEKLKQDFGMVIEGLDPLPMKDELIDLRKVFTIVRQAIMAQKNWDVIENCLIGIFSFTQFVMWNDIRNRSDDLEKNKIVKSLMDGRLSWETQDMEAGEKVEEEGVFLPLPADASQLYAIESAGKGESFVLHGPPGTGKSQSITVLIANALAQGKKVLFVAEKMAALEVVQKRLEKIGIGPFCLELHSNKSKKKDVLSQLQRVIEISKYADSDNYTRKAAQLSEIRKKLDRYAEELHDSTKFGVSLYSLINEYEENSDAPDLSINNDFDYNTINKQVLEDDLILVERLKAAGIAIGHPYNHPLQRVRRAAYSQQLRASVPDRVAEYKKELTTIRPAMEFVSKQSGISLSDETGIKLVSLFLKENETWYSVPRAWAKLENIKPFSARVDEMCSHFLSAHSLQQSLSERWDNAFFSLDAAHLLEEYNTANSKWVLPKVIEKKNLVNRLAIYSKGKINRTELPQDLLKLVNYQNEKNAGNSLLSQYSTLLEDLYTGQDTDWAKIQSLSEAAKASAERLYNTFGTEQVRIHCCGIREWQNTTTSLLNHEPVLAQKKDALYSLLEIKPQASDNWFSEELALCDAITGQYDDLREWIAWNSIADEARSKGLRPVVYAYESGIDHESVIPAFKKNYSQALAMKLIDSSETLNQFSGAVFNETIEQFRRLDKEFTEVTRQEIYCRLAARIPNFAKEAAKSSEVGILQRAIRSNGRGISIRNLFSQIPNLLLRICPCMLMSPISAAQYLETRQALFDLVVFDEASQLPTCKAVGALARGHEAVIVGDPKQMPPTSFFMSNTLDEENIQEEDLESILDDCLALNMPQTHLLWHYRSRHESLIAFSNSEFYENKLFTFPSADERKNMVRLVHVDGCFDRGKTRQNRAEAEAVIAEIIRRASDDELKKNSIGIVTFNVSQQNLIEDLLNEACAKDPALEEWVFRSEEPVFIKNLENVQGDERDVILFSIGYGRDSTGKVSLNFGPLNREGGWRRLNVAVTRARKEMVVFSTLTPDQINLSRTSSKGVAALRAFLEYSAGHPLVQDENTAEQYKGNEHEGILDTVCRVLDEHGYQTDKNIGHSEFRIDIGVIDEESPDHYLAGIILDGKTYHSAKTTRDRELAQLDVLKDLGWNIVRIWSMDWWDNKEKELNRILRVLDSLKKGSLDETPMSCDNDQKENNDRHEDIRNDSSSRKVVFYKPRTYEAAQLPKKYVFSDEFQSLYGQEIKTNIEDALRQEAPISEELLMRRVAQSFGFSRAGSKIQARIMDILKRMNPIITKQDKPFYWLADQMKYYGVRANGILDGNKRDVTDIPYREAANGLCYVLSEQISLNREDLVRETAGLFGFTRMKTNVSAVFRSAVDFALTCKEIEQDENGIFTLTEFGEKRAERVKILLKTEEKNIPVPPKNTVVPVSTPAVRSSQRKTYTWEEFYNNYEEWAVSTAVSRLSSVDSLGPKNQIIDVIEVLDNETAATKLINKALKEGIRFTVDDYVELIISANDESRKQLLNSFDLSGLESKDILTIAEETSDDSIVTPFVNKAVDAGFKFNYDELEEIYNYISTEGWEYILAKRAFVLQNAEELVNLFGWWSLDDAVTDQVIQEFVDKKIYMTVDQAGELLCSISADETIDKLVLLIDQESLLNKSSVMDLLNTLNESQASKVIIKAINAGTVFTREEAEDIENFVDEYTSNALSESIEDAEAGIARKHYGMSVDLNRFVKGIRVVHINNGEGVIKSVTKDALYIAFDKENTNKWEKEVVQKLNFPACVQNGYVSII